MGFEEPAALRVAPGTKSQASRFSLRLRLRNVGGEGGI